MYITDVIGGDNVARLALFDMPFSEFEAKTMEYIDKYGDKEGCMPGWSHLPCLISVGAAFLSLSVLTRLLYVLLPPLSTPKLRFRDFLLTRRDDGAIIRVIRR